MNAIIIEDEYLAAAELERLLGEVAPEITILTKLDSVSGSVKWLKKNKADVIFMDIHLGDGQSFDIFEQVEITVPVIFITAYDEYALKAFKYKGIDYILIVDRVSGAFSGYRGDEDEIRDGGGCCLFHGGRKVSGTFHP